MKRKELDATYANLLYTLRENAIGRNQDLRDFLKFIDSVEGHVNISIDGEWGSGKTFFVKQAIMLLDYYRNREKEGGQEDAQLIHILDQRPLNSIQLSNTFLTVYYDAWLYDDHEDSLMSLIYSIIKQSDILSDNAAKRVCVADKIKALAQVGLTLCGTGIDVEKLLRAPESYTKQVEDIEYGKNLLKQIFDELLVENASKLIIFVDELDRCKPSYAIQLLEKIKHFFDDDRVVFIFSTNKNELIHTVGNCYGTGFNGTLYLNRFFDFQFSLNKINIENYLIFLNPNEDMRYYDYNIMMSVGKYYGFSMREFNIYSEKMKDVQGKYNKEFRRDLDIYVKVFGSVLCALSILDTSKERLFKSGNLKDEVLEVYRNVDIFKNYVDRFLNTSESTREKTLIELYNYIFSTDIQKYPKAEGIEFEPISRNEFLNIVCQW